MSESAGSEPALGMSIEEYEQLPESDEHKDELVRGEVVREPRPGPYHGSTQIRLGARLLGYADEHALGAVFTDVGVVISHQPRTVRGPDILFYGTTRLPRPLPSKGFLQIPPDLAVEIVSPSNSASDIIEKVTEYLDADVRMVWVVDPGSRTATVYRSREKIRILGEQDELDGTDVVPGFRVRLRDVLP
jgi:Uma2 family endonuclease